MANKARTKGHNGELELARLINEILPLDAKRNLTQVRDGGADINLEGLCVEVKRQETLNLNTWWDQVCRAADDSGGVPVLAYRQNRRPWNFVLPGYLLVPGCSGRLTMDADTFAAFLEHWFDGLEARTQT